MALPSLHSKNKLKASNLSNFNSSNSSKLITQEYRSPYVVLLHILEFFLSRLAMLPHGLYSILPNYLPTCYPSNLYFYYYANCIL